MLTHLQIKNLALCDNLDIEIKPELTVLTGETGAGKSILIRAIAIALGKKAAADLVRKGAERAEIALEFDIGQNPKVQAWLTEQDLNDQQSCHIRRTIPRTGRGRAYINGMTAPLTLLEELGSMLMDIHSQHEHHALIRKDYQRQLLDRYGKGQPLLDQLSIAWQTWRSLCRKLDSLESGAHILSADESAFLRAQIAELEASCPAEGELERLSLEQRRLAHAAALIQTGQESVGILDDDESGILSRLRQVRSKLDSQIQLDNALPPIAELLDNASIHLEEALGEFRHWQENIDLDPSRLHEIDERLGQIHDLARKHRIQAQELPLVLKTLSDKLERDAASTVDRTALEKEIVEAEKGCKKLAAQLHTLRTRAASQLSQEVTEHMRALGIPHGSLSIDVISRPDEPCSRSGNDHISFLISTHPDMTPAPIEKAASGGELSRICLAIQVVTARQGIIDTLVFDEVDVGIGGGIAEVVGQHLRLLAGQRQVLCITHLPQVAALGHHHLRVEKSADKDGTRSEIHYLAMDDRRQEVARMLGGIDITEQTLELANEMLVKSPGMRHPANA